MDSLKVKLLMYNKDNCIILIKCQSPLRTRSAESHLSHLKAASHTCGQAAILHMAVVVGPELCPLQHTLLPYFLLGGDMFRPPFFRHHKCCPTFPPVAKEYS